LCWYHHHTIDTAGWTIRMVQGRPQIRGPLPWDPSQTWRPAHTHRANTPRANTPALIHPGAPRLRGMNLCNRRF
jgi:hypothetical protein